MQKSRVWKKLLSATLVGVFAVTPIIMGTLTAHAAPPRHAPIYRRNDYRSFKGRVTKVDSSRKFDMQVDGKTYDVYLSSPAPHRLSKNDEVRVYGRRYGNNDIRDARVIIFRNR